MSNTNGLSLNQNRIEKKAAELGIPSDEARRMLAKMKLRDDS